MKKSLTFFSFLLICNILWSQNANIPTIEPTFFAADEEITITYDVTGTSLQSLTEAWIWMWIPGKGIDAPSNVNPANSNTAATDAAKLTRTTSQTGRIFFSITLTPTTFLNVSKEQIESIGMLLKGNDWSNGKTADYEAEVSNGFSMSMTPSQNYGFYSNAQDISIEVQISEPGDIDITVDGLSIATATTQTSLNTTHSIIDDGAVHEIKATATNGSETISRTYTYTLTPTPENQSLPPGTVDGINYNDTGTSATLALRAPNKQHVFIIGDFNNWSLNQNYLMKKDGEVFWLTIDNLEPQTEYLFQYLVDGELRIADPYSEKISSPFDDGEIISDNRYPGLKPYPASETTEAASFLKKNQATFNWTPFIKPANEDLVIYELLVRDFTDERTFEAVTARLDYLAELGVNALELMPVNEFEGNLSWGYNPAFMFAVDKYYGTELDLKTLIDEAHKRGMAVILDIVLNHQFGRSPLVRLYNEGTYGNPTSDNPWFNTSARHDFNVGYDMNHESQYTKSFVDRVVRYWIQEYNIDGYRFDLSKGFTQKYSVGNIGLWGQYDANRVALLKRMADVIWQEDPNAYVILEHFADNLEEKELAEYGMMLWGNMTHSYSNVAKGSLQAISTAYHEGRGWTEPHLIAYMESHDEERLMWNLRKTLTERTSIERAKLAAAFFLPVPGPKMIWQFGEFGYDLELNDDRLGIKPTRWEYLEDDNRKRLFNLYKSLINLRTKTNYIDKEYFEWNTSGYVKTINITHPEVEIYIVGNFDDSEQTANHNFSSTGTWYDYFTGESFEVTEANEEVVLHSAEWHIYTSVPIDNYIEDEPVVLSSELQSNPELKVYPNPTSEYVYVFGAYENSGYQIRSISGQIVKSGTLADNKGIRLSNLESGIYILDVQQNAKKHSFRILIR